MTKEDFHALQFITLYTGVVTFISLSVNSQCVHIHMKAIEK